MTFKKPSQAAGGGRVRSAWPTVAARAGSLGCQASRESDHEPDGILSARVVVTPQGEVTEVHVLTLSDVQPKQVVRNIESALMAQLGLKIDHRKISVAQTADVRPIEALQHEAIAARAKRRVVVFRGLEVRPSDRPAAHSRQGAAGVRGSGGRSGGAGDGHHAQPRRSRSPRGRLVPRPAASRQLRWRWKERVLIEAFDRKFVLVAVHGLGGGRLSCSRAPARFGRAPSGALFWPCWTPPIAGPMRGGNILWNK